MAAGLKLKRRMRLTLNAVVRNGGIAVPGVGGCWYDECGDRLQIRIDRWGAPADVVNATIKALERRGLLERMYKDACDWRDPRRVTEAGYAAETRVGRPIDSKPFTL